MNQALRIGPWARISRLCARCLIGGTGLLLVCALQLNAQPPARRPGTAQTPKTTPKTSEPDRKTAGSDVVGKLMPVRDPAEMVSIPPAHERIMEANLQRIVAIVGRNPAFQPPVGFNLQMNTHAYAPPLPVSPRAPLASTMTGYFYWYTYMPGPGKIQALGVAMHAFYVRANDISQVFNRLDRWQNDERGLTYLEPREIRKVAGFPQYGTGCVVLKRNPRPIWVPVSREWALQRELAQRRKNLDALPEPSKTPGASDAEAELERWIAERPERQREMESGYAELKESSPEYAEKSRANFFETEKRMEKMLRDTVERQKAAPPRRNAPPVSERDREEKCVRYLEGELARLSPADRAAPAYISTRVLDTKRPPSEPVCSFVVDASFSGATRLVTENPDYYDPALPPSAIQVILVDFSDFEGSVPISPAWRHAVYERIRDGLDYSALAAMLRE